MSLRCPLGVPVQNRGWSKHSFWSESSPSHTQMYGCGPCGTPAHTVAILLARKTIHLRTRSKSFLNHHSIHVSVPHVSHQKNARRRRSIGIANEYEVDLRLRRLENKGQAKGPSKIFNFRS